jgi:hypothetical protein
MEIGKWRAETDTRNPPRELFEAVYPQLAERKVRRKLARSKSSAILMGLIFDDRGHPMSPSHADKKGVRYRYFVSHGTGKPTQVQSPACRRPMSRRLPATR